MTIRLSSVCPLHCAALERDKKAQSGSRRHNYFCKFVRLDQGQKDASFLLAAGDVPGYALAIFDFDGTLADSFPWFVGPTKRPGSSTFGRSRRARSSALASDARNHRPPRCSEMEAAGDRDAYAHSERVKRRCDTALSRCCNDAGRLDGSRGCNRRRELQRRSDRAASSARPPSMSAGSIAVCPYGAKARGSRLWSDRLGSMPSALSPLETRFATSRRRVNPELWPASSPSDTTRRLHCAIQIRPVFDDYTELVTELTG